MARPKNCGKCNKPKRPRGNKFKEKEGYCVCGRPTVMDATMLQKLEDAFMIGLNDVKACAYAEIAKNTLYNYEKENPKFLHRKVQLRLKPDLLAQQTIVKALYNPNHAWKWLEKKDKDFMPISEVKHSGSIDVSDLTEEMSQEEKDALVLLRKARRKRIEDKSKELE